VQAKAWRRVAMNLLAGFEEGSSGIGSGSGKSPSSSLPGNS